MLNLFFVELKFFRDGKGSQLLKSKRITLNIVIIVTHVRKINDSDV